MNTDQHNGGGGGWFTAFRTEDAFELCAHVPNAFRLAYIIAHRSRWKDGFNRHGIAQGEALLGDLHEMGFGEQEYRTAKKQLEKWQFATFKGTNKGTVARLTDTRLFDIHPPQTNEPANRQATSKQRATNEQLTTTGRRKERKNEKNEKNGGDTPLEHSTPAVNNGRFAPPSLDQVKLLSAKVGLPEVEAEKFFNHFTANGWKVGGKAPMRSWQHALANWKHRYSERPSFGGRVEVVPDHSKGF